MTFSQQRRSLLSSTARVMSPFVKVSIGDFTFGVFTAQERKVFDTDSIAKSYDIQYPNYVQSLVVKKINGQVNRYTLSIAYPVRFGDDPNFFEKVFSSVSKTRRITFSYGDAAQPATSVYKDETAVITNVSTSFSYGSSASLNSVIHYTINAISDSALGTATALQMPSDGQKHRPSDVIKSLFRNPATGLKSTFKGMTESNIDKLIDGDDQPVLLDSKLNISALDYITYLVSCMIPQGSVEGQFSNDIYILSIHDDTIYDQLNGEESIGGSYFTVRKTSYAIEHADAYEIDIGVPTASGVLGFSVSNNSNYSLYYDYQNELNPTEYTWRINSSGDWEQVYAPAITSRNNRFQTRAEDRSWWTKITKFPVSGSITIQGLLRPAQLMTYIRINVIFPGGQKHITSGLYLITSQTDTIDGSGYKTELGITKIGGDTGKDQFVRQN